MRAHVLLNLLNELGKRDKMRGLPKTEEIPFWVRFGYGSHLKAKLFSTSCLACLAR